MWESNMAVAFNFPDNNELKVQKEVDLSNVTDDDFKKCFTGRKIFNFTIQNQATHYGEKKAADPDTSGTHSQVVNLETSTIEPATPNNDAYIFEKADNPGPDSGTNKEKVLHWYARYMDTEPVSKWRKNRYGILTLKEPINIENERFLTFEVYVKHDDGGELSLNNLYLELLDEQTPIHGQKGSLGTTGINGATYGSVELKTDQWVTVKLDLHKMKEQGGSDGKFSGNVTTIRVGDNYSRNIYFRNFTFIPKAKPSTMSGFTTKQEDIPDYGSVKSGQLQNAENAQYTSNMDTDTQLVEGDGSFVLEAGETVTFSDQFRRGSYISLKEDLNQNLYDTTWTVYENGQKVTSMIEGNSVSLPSTIPSLDGQKGRGPNDGRTENKGTDDEQKGNNYTGTKPDTNTIVFRSYNDPDENSSTLTKLKVEYVNTVKTGGLKIQKKAAAGEVDNIKGTYKFKVTFNNVGGEGLEDGDIIREYTIDMSDTQNPEHICTITGIPVGTRYTIEEVKPKDSRLQSVTVTGGENNAHLISNDTMVEGVIVESADPKNPEVTAIFTNTRRTLINIAFDKLWKDADGTDLSTKNQPNEIYIQLQRRLETQTSDKDWKPVKYPTADSPDYVTITRGDNGWQFTFSNLDQYPVDDTNTNYQYRIVEGTVDDKGKFTQANGTITIDGNTYGVTVTAKATPKSEADSTGSSTGNTATANSETNSETGATTTPATATDGTITGDSGTIVLTNTLQNPKFVLNIIKKDAEKDKNNNEVFLKDVEFKLEKLKADEKKDDVVTFEELGVDRLFVDEAHAFKNGFLATKMRNVAGIATSESQKSTDMFLKCRYMDELTGGRGVIFATGTPVSNSMTELYTMQRYLQYGTLEKMGLIHFDAWASTFGETVTAIELAPEGTGYRARTRFAKFFNLPELMAMFKEVADIKTADQLHLPVPNAHYETMAVKPSVYQEEMVEALSERASKVHSGAVDPKEDNMLRITSDGRKLGLDQRLMNPLLPDEPGSKVNACMKNILRIYKEGDAQKLTQLVFCDLSTPHGDGSFNVYDDIRDKLVASGIPKEEIQFIHDADTEIKKKELFAKVRSGQVRILFGSTQKLGAGTNVQDRLIALHDLDAPWRPGDLEQRAGRIVRQGNMNPDVHIYRYVTEKSFDSYLWQTIENKQRFISQIMSSRNCTEYSARYSRPYKNRNTSASSTLDAGPASAVSAMPRLGLRKRIMFTGTGFAQPNLNTTIISRPIMSICLSGLSVRRPASFAVGSPRRYATQPCDTS